MAPLAPLSPTLSPVRMPRRWARKCERYCCLGFTYFPLVFVYSITTWAVWVEATIGLLPSRNAWIGGSGIPFHTCWSSRSLQEMGLRFSELLYTFSLTGHIQQLYSRVRGPQLVLMTAIARFQRMRLQLRQTLLSNRMANYVIVRNARPGSRIVHTIAQLAKHVF